MAMDCAVENCNELWVETVWCSNNNLNMRIGIHVCEEHKHLRFNFFEDEENLSIPSEIFGKPTIMNIKLIRVN